MTWPKLCGMTHHTGCQCHEANRDAVIADLRSALASERLAHAATKGERDAWIAELEIAKAGHMDAMVQRDAAVREADRWRHGVPIEGDYICTYSLDLAETREMLAGVEAAAGRLAEAVRRHVGNVYAWARTASDAGETAEESLRSAPTIEDIRDALRAYDQAGRRGEGGKE